MKRFLTMLLALCLVTGTAPFAFAETSPLRVLAGNQQTAEAYLEAYPDRAVRIIDVDYTQGYRGNLAELLKDGEWDVAFVSTDDYSVASLVEAGLATDLSVFPEIAAQADDLYPRIRAAVTADGKLMAFPANYVASMVMGLQIVGTSESNTDTYAQRAATHLRTLGFTADDQPETFAQLCTLGENYMQLPKDARRGTTFITSEGNPTAYVLDLLINLYTSQYIATGECADFDTEVFRTALGQMDALGAALATDPKNTYDDDGLCFLLVSDCSQLIINEGVFLQLGDHQDIPARMGMAVINPKSPRAQEAADYIILKNGQNACYTLPNLFQSIDYDALVRQSYDDEIAAQIKQHENQSVIDTLIALRDANDTSRYQYSKAEIEHYRTEVAPKLIFPQHEYFDTQSAVRQYLLGKLDADGFIAELNRAAAQP